MITMSSKLKNWYKIDNSLVHRLGFLKFYLKESEFYLHSSPSLVTLKITYTATHTHRLNCIQCPQYTQTPRDMPVTTYNKSYNLDISIIDISEVSNSYQDRQMLIFQQEGDYPNAN